MNREYKFKGKRKDNGEWICGLLMRKQVKAKAIDFITHGKRISSDSYIQTCRTVNDVDILEEFKVFHDSIGQFVDTYKGVDIFENDEVDYNYWIQTSADPDHPGATFKGTGTIVYSHGGFFVKESVNGNTIPLHYPDLNITPCK